jgi:type I restriction enzyme S subunit
MTERFRSDVVGYTNGTTVNMLSADGLKYPLLAVPPQKIISTFEAIAAPLFEKIEQNYEESRTLVATRNTLLPKLMSGEIRVKEAEKILEDVA